MEESRLIDEMRAVEDYLAPQFSLDAFERTLYYHLLRRSHLAGQREVIVSVKELMRRLNCSRNAVKSRLRSLNEKGVLSVVDTGWTGTQVRVYLPSEIPGCMPMDASPEPVDIEEIDFYSDPRYRDAIFRRENGRCFYCRRKLTRDNYGLDHVEPQVAKGANSYRNLVAACHRCNSSKGSMTGEDFTRSLYRNGFLSEEEFAECLSSIELLRGGKLKPPLD